MKRTAWALALTRWARRREVAAVVTASMLMLAAGEARLFARDDKVALVWSAPTGCSSADAVHAQVEETLGNSLKDLAPVAAVVTVAHGFSSWRASLNLVAHGQRSEREFGAESCDALAAATALIVALAAQGLEQPAPDGSSETSVVRRASREPGAPPFWVGSSYVLQFAATFDNGTMPYSFAPGIEASAGGILTAAFWRLRLLGGASYYITQTGGGGPNDVYLGTYRLLSFAARACATATLGRLEFGPCIGGELAFMHGENVGNTGAGDSQYWFAPLGGLTAAFTVSSQVAIYGRGEAAFPTTLRTFMGKPFAADTADPVYDVPPNALRLTAGVELRFF